MALDGVVRFPSEFAARYRAAGYWEDRLLIEHYEDAFRSYADRVAILDDDQRLTYAELAERSMIVARNLFDLGLRPLDRVVVQLRNTALFPSFYLGLQHLGAIPVMALPVHRYREVEQFVRLADAVALASPATAKDVSYLELFDRVAGQQPSLRLHFVEGPVEEGGARVSIDQLHVRTPRSTEEEIRALRATIDPEDPAVFQLSGGTTGIPKLIPRSHNDYAFNSKLAASVCDIREGDVLLDVLPLSHNLPLACPGMQGFLFSGATVSLMPVPRADAILRRIDRDGATHIHLVPALLIKLLEAQQETKADLGTMRVIQSGGQRLQPETRLRVPEVFPVAQVQENFGMAEGLLMFVRLDDPEDVRLETVGRPICPDDEVRLLDEDGRDVPDGEIGELAARGPYTLRGYFRAPEQNRLAFTDDGFYLSGDLMVRTASGNYVVAGRRKDLINRGGEKISAEEIENLMLSHPSIVLAAVVPMPDPVLGERMCACVVLREGARLELAELVEFLAGFDLARFKLPEALRVYDELPLSPIGKVSKKDLVADIAATSA
ncbi:(2,3-dihydroxybenzoyl)adenylate synthase [Naasia aerilata]|uniref:2,3-dihydroxybenzoate-AMP ligase n=1 Tax=Naasia aerilata TaxID=1162966 RepID=A0ABM8GH90_9MICO|nr:AMP-binding protein [Naasia aerilata]BDZ44119.1 2,3-dihydroxybenzoate-AMP ligase [Naasia aerilata]BDZ47730.1 2,3-dihydroxybenzoate-AMP ligase [Naasia aerilata]